MKIMSQFLSEDELKNTHKIRSVYRDICRCFCKYKTSPLEFFLFDFRTKNSKERAAYISDRMIMKYAADKSGRKIHDKELNNKYNFYLINKDFFNRKVTLFDNDTSLDEFCETALSLRKLIAKPNTAALGTGVRIFEIQNLGQAQYAFHTLKDTGIDYVLEEFIKQNNAMAEWNESCVNTIRINSFLSHGKFNILCPFMRTGRKGSIVDNGGQGGIFASVDIESGIVTTNGMDEMGHIYTAHPDSGIIYKGWRVPNWLELIRLTEKCHRNMPKHAYISWDFALTDNGWVMIEGNWGEFVCQQMTLKKGFKNLFKKYINLK